MKNLRKFTIAALSILSAASLTAAGNGGKRAEWIFSKAKNPKAAIDFVESGRYCSQAGEPSEISFVRAKRSADPAKKLSHKNGMPIAENTAAGDYWLFEMPVEHLDAGTVIDFWAMFFCNPCDTPHKFMFEYCDGGKWIPVYEPKKEDGVKYNCLSTTESKHPRRLWQSVRLSKPVDNGAVRFRIRQSDKAVLSTQLGGSTTGQSPKIVCYDASVPRDTLKILFVGNSYTYYNEYPVIFKEIAWREGHYADCDIFVSGGYTMKAHLANKVSRETVEKGGYDYAFLQDQSFNAVLIGTEDDKGVVENMSKMTDRIKKYSPDAKTVIEITWGRKFGSNNLGKKYEYLPTKYPSYFSDYNAMQNRLTDMITEEARITGSQVSPVGIAWQIVRRERPDIELYGKDAHHPSYAGSYLSAVVAYLTVYRTPFGDNPINGKLDAATAAYLRDAAQRAVLAGEK